MPGGVQSVRACMWGKRKYRKRERRDIGIGEWEGLPLDDISPTENKGGKRHDERNSALGLYLCSVL